MNEPSNKKQPVGRVYAQVGQLILQYEGEIEETLEKVRIQDIRSGQTIDLNRDAVKQIIWRARAAPAQRRVSL